MVFRKKQGQSRTTDTDYSGPGTLRTTGIDIALQSLKKTSSHTGTGLDSLEKGEEQIIMM